MTHRCINCPETNALRKFHEEELSDTDRDFQFHYSQCQTTDRVSLSHQPVKNIRTLSYQQ